MSTDSAGQNLDISFLTITTSKTKEDVIIVLQKNEYKLQRIPLIAPVVTAEQTAKDFKRERVLFNDVPFIPDTLDMNRSHTFALTLKLYVDILLCKERGKDIIKSSSPKIQTTSSSTTFDISSSDIADIIMQKACRTSAGADSFFMVQKLFCVSGTFVTQRTSSHDPPIKVDLFLSTIKSNNSINNNANINTEISNSSINVSENSSENEKNNSKISIVVDKQVQSESNIKCLIEGKESFQSCLCARTEVRNSFVVYDIDSMDQITGIESQDPPPWLSIESVVVDETNFTTGFNSRNLHFLVTPSIQNSNLPSSLKSISPKKTISNLFSPIKNVIKNKRNKNESFSSVNSIN